MAPIFSSKATNDRDDDDDDDDDDGSGGRVYDCLDDDASAFYFCCFIEIIIDKYEKDRGDHKLNIIIFQIKSKLQPKHSSSSFCSTSSFQTILILFAWF